MSLTFLSKRVLSFQWLINILKFFFHCILGLFLTLKLNILNLMTAFGVKSVNSPIMYIAICDLPTFTT